MRRLHILAAASGAACGIIAPVAAAPVYLAGTVDLRLGYGSNPYLAVSPPGGSGLVGANLSAILSHPTPTSDTTLTGRADVEQDFKHYGRSESYGGTLSRTQQFSTHLSGNAYVSYDSTVNPYRSGFGYGVLPSAAGSTPAAPDATTPPPVVTPPGGPDLSNVDLLTVGQRTRTLTGGAGLNWQLSERDQFQVAGYASHSSYSSSQASSYTSYGGNASFVHALNGRTKIGAGVNVSRTISQGRPATTAYEPNVSLVQQLSAFWVFNGQVGVIFQDAGATVGGKSTSLGFSASLCGTYPRSTICVTGSRQAAPSGYGGQRIDTRAGLSLSYALSERSRVRLNATYDESSSQATSIVPTQRYYQIGGGYTRSVSRRISVGFSGSYQRRDYSNLRAGVGAGAGNQSASGYTATVDLIAHFGRTS